MTVLMRANFAGRDYELLAMPDGTFKVTFEPEIGEKPFFKGQRKCATIEEAVDAMPVSLDETYQTYQTKERSHVQAEYSFMNDKGA